MDDAESFAKGVFHADCSVIELSREGENPFIVRGPGHIEQDADGKLKYSIHLVKEEIRLLSQEVLRPTQRGAIIPRENYMCFNAKTYRSTIWNANLASPEKISHGNEGDGMVRGSLNEMKKVKPSSHDGSKDYATLLFQEQFDFPITNYTKIQKEGPDNKKLISHTADTAQFSIGDETFILHKDNNIIGLTCTFEKGAIKKYRHIRIQEALQFALAQKLLPRVIELSDGDFETTTYRSIVKKNKEPQQDPPLSFHRGLGIGGDIYEIVKSYYGVILSNEKDQFHPLSSHIYSLIEAGRSALELQSLSIPVSAEGIISTCFPDIAPVDKAVCDEIDECLRSICKLSISSNLKKRIAGSLGQMKGSRNSDRLRAFIKKYRYDEKLFNSWKYLRNPSTHGGKIDIKDIDKIVGALNDVLFLCYAIVLQYCEYKGSRTDYSKLGHPDFTP